MSDLRDDLIRLAQLITAAGGGKIAFAYRD